MVHQWLLLTFIAMTGAAGDAPQEGLVNGGMEGVNTDGTLEGWWVPPTLVEAGYKIGPESGDVFAGKGAARLDSRKVTAGGNLFGNLMQSIDATPYRGKRVRFRAAVKVAEAEAGGQAHLWLRVDLAAAGTARRTGFFDNMQDRPIVSKKWKTYEIVGDVAPDAQKIALGVLTLGQCLAFADDATLDVVDKEFATTGGGDLELAPTQPFFTRWLVLPLVGLALFALAFLGSGRIGKFAFEFTLVYWTLYTLSALIASLVPWGGTLGFAYESGPVDAVVRWTAATVLGIKGALVSALRNGSGDTTFSYVQALVTFVLALAAAAVWSLVDRRATDHPRLKGILRSALRYYLATQMLGYGLAKLSTLFNQFPVPGVDRLASTYGASSPMGLLWTFMGSSRAYTAFAGASETLGGVLLLWRRTALLGALASMGCMLHVLILNLCYDVPVKLFSFHLLVAGVCIALPDARRLAHFFLGVGSGAATTLVEPFSGGGRKWIHHAVKLYLIVMVLGLPMFQYWRMERGYSVALAALGEWKLSKLEADGRAITPETGEVGWLTLRPQFPSGESTFKTDYVATLIGGSSTRGTATITAGGLELAGTGGGPSRLVPGKLTWRVVGEDLHLDTPTVHAIFTPSAQEYLLMRRGFRWINERPFNR